VESENVSTVAMKTGRRPTLSAIAPQPKAPTIDPTPPVRISTAVWP
jgi:hypothetical protein